MVRKFNHKYIFYIFIILSILVIITSLFPSLAADEPFTISLIKHNYNQIINIDLFDVHPPFYYLFLKSFLIVTTFWTRHIVVKIIFARLLSFSLFLLSFFVLLRILQILRVYVNCWEQFILFLTFPTIAQYSFVIRMYQLSALFIVVEIYGMLIFRLNRKRLGVVLVLLMNVLSFYTNYFTALFAGVFLVVNILNLYIKKRYKRSLYLLCLSIVDLVLCMPCFYFLLHQLKYVSSNNYSNFVDVSVWGRNIYSQLLGAFTGHSISGFLSFLISIIMIFIELILSFYIYKLHNRFSKTFFNIYITFLVGFIPPLILSFIKHPMIMGRYGYPIFFVFYFFIISFILNVMHNKEISFYVSSFLCVFLLILGVHSLQESFEVDKVSIPYLQMERSFNNRDSHIMYVNGTKAINCSTYLDSSSNKRIISTSLPIRSTLASNNKKLMCKIFSNIKYVPHNN